MTKLERLKQEQEKIEKLFDEGFDADHKNNTIFRLYCTASELVSEMIYEQEQSIKSGKRKHNKNIVTLLNLAEKNYCMAIKLDSAFRGDNYDPWEITLNATIEEAKEYGIKDKRTVIKFFEKPTYRSWVELYGPKWDDKQAWKGFFQPFLDNKNYRLPESEQKELIELRSRMELPWDTLLNMFIENEKKRDPSFRLSEDVRKELKELRSRLEPYQGQ